MDRSVWAAGSGVTELQNGLRSFKEDVLTSVCPKYLTLEIQGGSSPGEEGTMCGVGGSDGVERVSESIMCWEGIDCWLENGEL